MKFSQKDKIQYTNKGISLERIQAQLDLFKKGLPFVKLKAAATVGHGILKLDANSKKKYINYFEARKDEKDIVKFVPASGAATRMFKFLFEFLDKFNPDEESINAYINKHKATELSIFIVGLEQFPFYEEVVQQARTLVPNFNSLSNNDRKLLFIKTMLDADKLNFSYFPKGLLPFHKYQSHNASAFEEHLFEAALYAEAKGKANLHFTISKTHKQKFGDEFKRIEGIVAQKTNTEFDIEFSFQLESTDTIAVNSKNEPIREADGSLHFRPSGHGALLHNLNSLEADIVFIKNIDNVVVFKFEEQVAEYKKMLAGLLIETQEKSYDYLNLLEQEEVSEDLILEAATFLAKQLNVVINPEFEKFSKANKIEYVFLKLNRPIRVCGMVKNEGEPGGGPFWVKGENGEITLQIVESAQIDLNNKEQKKILKNATHFNPVDLVCGIRNYKGDAFDLTHYVDPNTAFISTKTKAGKRLKALELPGLWNGSMAKWNTIFVEVPLITFNPVKTVNDLLKTPHQID
ncbi:MAG: DUF4301 family protein [Bacteroidia bacterium]|nr:DUF4301 family protein [Bacteroidia bacterium]NNK61100.1 DUF4301 family protein [Flavobacteriaceae bacterium]